MSATEIERKVLNHYQYDSLDDLPDDVLISGVRAAERVLGNPAEFPNADLDYLKDIYPCMCGVAAGRLLSF